MAFARSGSLRRESPDGGQHGRVRIVADIGNREYLHVGALVLGGQRLGHDEALLREILVGRNALMSPPGDGTIFTLSNPYFFSSRRA